MLSLQIDWDAESKWITVKYNTIVLSILIHLYKHDVWHYLNLMAAATAVDVYRVNWKFNHECFNFLNTNKNKKKHHIKTNVFIWWYELEPSLNPGTVFLRIPTANLPPVN